MNTIRAIQHEFAAKSTREGAGVLLKRVFGYHQVPLFDPFLLLDDFHSENPDDYSKGFPWHPHRGIETITYLLFGRVEHMDSLGNKGIIRAGDAQWMTAGSGIIHQEMPQGEENGRLWGIQLWSNLPSAQKMTQPQYREIKKEDIPVVTLDSEAKIRIISGKMSGVQGPVQGISSEPELYDISLPPHASIHHDFTEEHTVFAYILEGNGFFAPGAMHPTLPEHVVLFSKGKAFSISTEEDPVRFLLVGGKPFSEPVAWSGPIVMNTEAELRQAFEEYRNGTFLQHASTKTFA